MPLAGTCSAAISAACHPKQFDPVHAQRRIHWGEEVDGFDEDIGRCTFTSGAVRYPTDGRPYA